ncbi:hypothetical protein INH39_33165 [Massilia violaceinigra]|uniref:Uncharacterized protein n=1 Tax=Massilia violaceinigra TaxID=2045208 RepID=A0ABY4A5T3_9BURK|nr:hypothetical protein [Massilia violaceinigra]UOD30138.1 hypothetical protein INH39_33165 [Massilia violaceinigra]
MATIKVLASGAFQIRVASKFLSNPFYATFDTREQAVAYSDQLKLLLVQAIVPATLAQEKGVQRSPWTVQRCIAEYLRSQSLPVSEEKLLDTIRVRIADVDTDDLHYECAEMWVRKMKHIDNFSPNTIRSKGRIASRVHTTASPALFQRSRAFQAESQPLSPAARNPFKWASFKRSTCCSFSNPICGDANALSSCDQ